MAASLSVRTGTLGTGFLLGAARPEEAPAGDRGVQLVACLVGGVEYGLEISRMREILRVGPITRLPQAPPHVRGVINLRGHIVPVLDLRVRLGLPEQATTTHSRVMVVEREGQRLGLLVDRVLRVLLLPAEALEPPPQETGQGRAFVKGLGKREDGVILILDLDRALARDFDGDSGLTAVVEKETL